MKATPTEGRPPKTAAVVLALVAGLGAPGAVAPHNPLCPVLTDQAVDPNIFTTYQGRTIYFCCTMCRQKFLADPSKYLVNLPALDPGAASGPLIPARAPSVSRMLLLAGRFHPVVIHFPIALLMTAGLAELLLAVTGRPCFAGLVRFLLPLGAGSALVAMVLGLAAEASARFPSELTAYLRWHEMLGIATSALAVVCTGLGEIRHRAGARWASRAFRIALAVVLVMVGVTGHLGAVLVYGPDHFSV